MKSPIRKSFYTITEAAKELGITRAAVHRAIKQRRLEAERGGHVPLTTRRFDDRPSHPLTPGFRRVVVTRALRTAVSKGKRITITLVACTSANKNEIEGDYLLETSGLQLVAYE
jgi:excisionase family DNA binding protein